MNIVRFFTVAFLAGVMLAGCADLFRSPYESFIARMDSTVATKRTIDELRSSKNGIADDEYFLRREISSDGSARYYYARLNLWDRYCYYHLIVEPGTQKVVGWEFDVDKADPRKECAASG